MSECKGKLNRKKKKKVKQEEMHHGKSSILPLDQYYDHTLMALQWPIQACSLLVNMFYLTIMVALFKAILSFEIIFTLSVAKNANRLTAYYERMAFEGWTKVFGITLL